MTDNGIMLHIILTICQRYAILGNQAEIAKRNGGDSKAPFQSESIEGSRHQ
jgi:hypothetical protein